MPIFKLPKFDIKFGKRGKFDTDIPTLEGLLPDADLKIPSPKLDFDVNMPSINMPDISGGIDVDGNMPSTDIDGSFSGDASGGFDINLPKFKLPKFGIKVGKPEIDSSDLSFSGPDVRRKLDVGSTDLCGNVDLDVETPEFDANVGDVDIDLNSPKVCGVSIHRNIDLDTSLEGEGSGSFNIKMPTFKMPNSGFKGKKGKINIDTPVVDIDLPTAEGEWKLSTPNISLPVADINDDVKKPSIEGETDVDILDAKIIVDSPDMCRDLKLKMPTIKSPMFGNNFGKNTGVDFELSDVDVEKPDVDLSLPDVNLNLSPKLDFDVKMSELGGDVRKPDFDSPALTLQGLDSKGKLEIECPGKSRYANFDLASAEGGIKSILANHSISSTGINSTPFLEKINVKQLDDNVDIGSIDLDGDSKVKMKIHKFTMNPSISESKKINTLGAKMQTPSSDINLNIQRPEAHLDQTKTTINKTGYRRSRIPVAKVSKCNLNLTDVRIPSMNVDVDGPRIFSDVKQVYVDTCNFPAVCGGLDLENPPVDSSLTSKQFASIGDSSSKIGLSEYKTSRISYSDINVKSNPISQNTEKDAVYHATCSPTTFIIKERDNFFDETSEKQQLKEVYQKSQIERDDPFSSEVISSIPAVTVQGQDNEDFVSLKKVVKIRKVRVLESKGEPELLSETISTSSSDMPDEQLLKILKDQGHNITTKITTKTVRYVTDEDVPSGSQMNFDASEGEIVEENHFVMKGAVNLAEFLKDTGQQEDYDPNVQSSKKIITRKIIEKDDQGGEIN